LLDKEHRPIFPVVFKHFPGWSTLPADTAQCSLLRLIPIQFGCSFIIELCTLKTMFGSADFGWKSEVIKSVEITLTAWTFSSLGGIVKNNFQAKTISPDHMLSFNAVLKLIRSQK
jgi:hypothetical protein